MFAMPRVNCAKTNAATAMLSRFANAYTAERLFAMNGVEGVTLREIQAEAGQSNSSVITYHFGSRPAWYARCWNSATRRSAPGERNSCRRPADRG